MTISETQIEAQAAGDTDVELTNSISIDIGGTFTDCVTLRHGELRVLKLPSTPHNPAAAVLAGIARLYASDRLPGRSVELRHGTTVGTNTMLERTGARCASIACLFAALPQCEPVSMFPQFLARIGLS